MNILHYEALTEFNKQFYKDLLTNEHLQPQEIRINKFSYPDSGIEEDVNFWGYKLNKDNKRYLLKSTDSDGNHLNLGKTLPIMVTRTEKIAYQNVVYYLILDYKTARFQSKKVMSFKALIDKLSSLKHSNPEHYRLSWFIGMAGMLNRLNIRVCSPPSFGKDSTVDIIGNLIGKSSTIVSPTLAKLEYMTNYKWLAINEVVDIPKDKYRDVEQFLLDAGAFKPVIAKHSRAMSGGSEMLDISNFSLTLLYNDITNYHFKVKYFDTITKDAVKDRFPPVRLYGGFTEDFKQSGNVDIPQFVKEHMTEYKDILYTYTYYKEHLFNELHHYETSIFANSGFSGRWMLNISRVLQMIDLYSDSKEEFEELALGLKRAMTDYNQMLGYPEQLKEKRERLKGKEWNDLLSKLGQEKTFTGKMRLLKAPAPSKNTKVLDSKEFW